MPWRAFIHTTARESAGLAGKVVTTSPSRFPDPSHPSRVVLFSRPPLPTMASYAQLTLPLYYVSASLVTCGSTWVLSDMGGESETRTLFFCRVFGSSSQEFGVTHCFRKLLNVNHVRKWVLSFDGILPQPQV